MIPQELFLWTLRTKDEDRCGMSAIMWKNAGQLWKNVDKLQTNAEKLRTCGNEKASI